MAKSEAKKVADALDERDRAAIDDAEARGRRQALAEMTEWLRARYLAPELDMTSANGKAIRTLAGDLVEAFAQPDLLTGEEGVDGGKVDGGTDA